MSHADRPLELSVDGAVAIVSLNRPQRFNCLSGALFDAFDAALDSIAANAAVRSVVVRGNGKHFCTGADLDEVLAARRTPDTMRALVDRGHAVLRRLETLPVPTIAAVHGLALAGGMELALSCDLLWMARSARIGDQHAQYGLYPAWGNSVRLPRLVGQRRALELLYSARWLDAAEAHAWGLANNVVDDDVLDHATVTYAHALARRNPGANAFVKSMCFAALEDDLEAALAREAEGASAGLLSANVSAGLAAFQARGEAEFD